MNSEITEEEIRRALFGAPQPQEQVSTPLVYEPVPASPFTEPLATSLAKNKLANAFTPRLRVTLRVGNEFEGEMHQLIHQADALSSLLAEQEAVKAAKKKYKYVDVVSVKPM